MDPAAAARLAWYSAGTGGVLGPRGWYCFGAYESNGTSLYVAPVPIQFTDVSADSWPAGSGPAIEAALNYGDTSGRFTVAEAMARVFPARSAFVQAVIAEGIEPQTQFPTGPFPTDRTLTKSATLVEYDAGGRPGPRDDLQPVDPRGHAHRRRGRAAGPDAGPAVPRRAADPDQQALVPAIVQQFEADSAAPAPAPGN